MGEIVKQDRAISIKEMLPLLDIAEDMAKGVIGHEERRKWILLGAFAVITYVGRTYRTRGLASRGGGATR
eukprot:3728358-Ditylum_brightwellii.AAC.1